MNPNQQDEKKEEHAEPGRQGASQKSPGEELAELLTARPATYSKKEKPRTAEKEQMLAPQEEYVEDQSRSAAHQKRKRDRKRSA